MSSSLREAWDSVPQDPEAASELGNDNDPLTLIHLEEDDRYIFLPNEENHLLDSEFIIADAESTTDVMDCR